MTPLKRKLLLEYASDLSGPLAAKVLSIIIDKGEATDEEISAKLKIDNPSEVRKILIKLHEADILTYRRERDENIGWYTYYWRLKDENIINVLTRRIKAVIKVLERKMEYEQNNSFYVCVQCLRRFTIEEAYDLDFSCPECGAILFEDNNEEIINILSNMINKIKTKIKEITK
ncbi:MAG: transcription initiation factor E subunit alpha [Thermoprotei archaeon]|nr:MAG: transcription initiation factor E subunit alpha [Thermoprotei archaeon]